MNQLLEGLADVNGPQGYAIAAAMREIAEVDGLHEAEDQLIRQFEQSLPSHEGTVDLSVIDTDELRDAYVKSMVLVAFADGGLTDLERQAVSEKSSAIGFSEDKLPGVYVEVAKGLLSTFSGVQIFREQAVEIGRSLGLNDNEIASVLS